MPVDDTGATGARAAGFNGIDAATGRHVTPLVSDEKLAALLDKRSIDGKDRDWLGDTLRELERQSKKRALKPGVDPVDLAQAGWSVVFAEDADPLVASHLEPLLGLRRRQAQSSRGTRYRDYRGRRGYRRGESPLAFLERIGGKASPRVDPARTPYYMLLVGGPEEIPYELQHTLAMRYAVGRIGFDRAENYRIYARSVERAESGRLNRRKEVLLWSARNPRDVATRLSHDDLVVPLLRCVGEQRGWKAHLVDGYDAGRRRLLKLLGNGELPPVWFSVSHGMSFPAGSPRQRGLQGALLCGDWLGPDEEEGEIPRELYLAGADVPAEASLSGTIVFNFACYSAGTPHRDNFAVVPSKVDSDPVAEAIGLGTEIAPAPFIAALPRRLLSLERGGALAVVGHVDRAWTTSFSHLAAGSESSVFESVLTELLQGARLGHAMRYMSEYHMTLAADVAHLEDPSAPAALVDAPTRTRMWRASNDARNFMILGDPAVRLGAAGR